MAQGSEHIFMEDEGFYVSQTRVTMMLHQPGPFSWQGTTGELRTFPTRDVASVRVASDNAGCARLLGIALVVLAVLFALSALVALARGEILSGFAVLVTCAVLGGLVIARRRWLFARTYYVVLETYRDSGVIQSVRSKDSERMRGFASAVGEAISARDYDRPHGG